MIVKQLKNFTSTTLSTSLPSLLVLPEERERKKEENKEMFLFWNKYANPCYNDLTKIVTYLLFFLIKRETLQSWQ